MSKNKRGGLTGNLEWGSKARKAEDAERNLNARARVETVIEQLNEYLSSGKEIECPYCNGTGVSLDDPATSCGFCVNGIHVVGT